MVDAQKLVEQAFSAREQAYAPYSGFAVGAALLCENGRVYTGCNIESVSFTPTNCGERTAFFKAVSEGERCFSAIAIVGGPKEKTAGKVDFCPPCGVCRQVMMEFCDPESFQVILAVSPQEYRTYTLEQLLPLGFGSGNLNQ